MSQGWHEDRGYLIEQVAGWHAPFGSHRNPYGLPLNGNAGHAPTWQIRRGIPEPAIDQVRYARARPHGAGHGINVDTVDNCGIWIVRSLSRCHDTRVGFSSWSEGR